MFCSWLSRNNALKILTLPVDNFAKLASSQLFLKLGFALFSPLSALALEKLTLVHNRITEDQVTSLLRGAQYTPGKEDEGSSPDFVCCSGRHRVLALYSSKTTHSGAATFLNRFGRAFRCLNLSHMPQAMSCLFLAQTALTACPLMEELSIVSWSADRLLPEVPAGVTAPTSLRELWIEDCSSDVAAFRSIARTLQLVGPSLRSLHVHGKRSLSTEFLVYAILTFCPQLRELGISYMDGACWKRLVTSYASGGCAISDLVLTNVSEEAIPSVLRTLTMTELPITHSLRTLRFKGSSAWSAELHATLVEMLDKNQFLVELVIPKSEWLKLPTRVKAGKFLPSMGYSLQTRQYAAVLSCSPVLAHSRVPRDIGQLIFQQSARPARRNVDPDDE